MITVKVKCFSQVKYALQKDEVFFQLDHGTTTDIVEKMIRDDAQGILDNVSLRVAVNQKYAPEVIELKNGDEIAFIPPVQGG